jgi:hypothetical protein
MDATNKMGVGAAIFVEERTDEQIVMIRQVMVNTNGVNDYRLMVYLNTFGMIVSKANSTKIMTALKSKYRF